jgi:HAD superfamily hydrolase (TIGR01509 family)
VVERCPDKTEVLGPIPRARTQEKLPLRAIFVIKYIKLFKQGYGMIKCAMFDFGNVIGIFDTPRWYDFIRRYKGNCREPWEMFAGGSLIQNILEFDRGVISDIVFYSRTRLAYKISTLTMADFYKEFTEILAIDYKMLRIVKDLKARGVITILVTNMNEIHADYIGSKYPEIFSSFDHLMISSREGVAKPDPRAFTLPLEWAGIEAREGILIDDSISNINAASKIGIVSWHYNVTDERWCMNGKLDAERKKLGHLLKFLKGKRLLYKTK